jgi:hypothetical protein
MNDRKEKRMTEVHLDMTKLESESNFHVVKISRIDTGNTPAIQQSSSSSHWPVTLDSYGISVWAVDFE